MIIKQIYNNNIVLAEDKDKKEVVLLGKGLAFGLNKGDSISPYRIEKMFELSKKNRYKFQELVKNLPLDYIMTSEEIVQMVKDRLKLEINDSIYITLTDHIMNIMERKKLGIEFDNAVLWNVKRLYKTEYEISLDAVEIIRKNLDIKINHDEASFIALHIVAAEINTGIENLDHIMDIVEKILEVVDEYFPDINKEDYSYERFNVHCRFFAQRVLSHDKDTDNKTNDSDVELFKTKYDKEFKCIQQISKYLKAKYAYDVTQGEQIYLLLHIVQLTS